MRRFLRTAPAAFALPLLLALAAPAGAAGTTGETGLHAACRLALERNVALAVERARPDQAQERVETERAAFDPKLAGELSASGDRRAGAAAAKLEASRAFASGDRASLSAQAAGARTGAPDGRTRLDLSYTRRLGEGGGGAALLRVREATNALLASRHELDGYVAGLLLDTAQAWLALLRAREEMAIHETALSASRERRRVVLSRIAAGRTAAYERAAVDAEVAEREEALLAAGAALERARLALAFLTGHPIDRAGELDATGDLPEAEPLPPAEERVAHARAHRPEIHEARLALERNELALARTRNGLLPALDLFVNLGQTAYADSFGGALTGAGGSERDVRAGIRLDEPLRARADRSAHRAAKITAESARISLANLERLIERDVRTAHLSARSADEKLAAASATRKAREAACEAERKKLDAGRSDAALLAAAFRDAVAARVNETRARVETVSARLDLARLDGSILGRFGVTTAGESSPGRAAPRARR